MKSVNTFVFDVDGVLTDGKVLITTDGKLLRNMNIKDGYALKTAVDNGYHVVVISGGKNEGVRARLQGLGITDIFLGAGYKPDILNEWMEDYAINPEQVLYMGDDIPDYEAMQIAGLATCPQNAAPEIKAICDYVSHKNGGDGCVRDVIEQVLKLHGKWMSNTDASVA